MLKRQRPASPSSSYDITEDEKSLPENLFEPMSKRRRYFAPSKFDSLSRDFVPPEDDDEEDEGQAGSSYRPVRREGVQEWRQFAEEYKEENAKLHDLHAEQRHRMLFSIHQPTGFSPSITNGCPAVTAQRSEGGVPSRRYLHDNPTLAPSSQDHARDTHVPNAPISAKQEAEVVSRRYEETNKLLGSLFLNRRRATGDGIEPSLR
ncbi:hypothetical protein PHLGIDRAFT_21665 [Phlebiopsis gigantea 11061_1 CR5-6]|uniref:Uncharacterized protein n=1 Tax=Phlebiopsis gigantea (strain 11061_1 CR5-6) TaxID=745531 RepID=A0A0C3SF50_PHLG1|nr:hypothetical protein PHLGIDRAFT_21665 [Phlebiopsis gigantea 11061_1 CR5-6]